MRGEALGEGSQMGGGEPDRPSRSAARQTRAGSADIDRRTFIRRAGQTGVAAGALVWSTPKIRSVGAQAAAGSPPPSNTTPTVAANNPIPPGGPTAAEIVVQGVRDDPGGNLALTGAELGNLAAIGGASVGIGELIRRKGLHRKRALEADAALYADPPPAGETPDPA
jgi:hypothetical protein